MAANVSARSPNSWACTSATGAASAAAAASAGTRLRSSLFGLDRLRITGPRCTRNGRSSRIVSLIWLPRPANESPKPISVFWASERVRGANVDSTSSSSGAAATALCSGIVAPASNVRRE